jgi:hypothetical protein
LGGARSFGPDNIRRYISVPERDGRFLRVVCRETDTEIAIVTVFFDRKAKRPA